ncbi:MOB kinase activator 2 isoform X4 [Pseudonaja textilis]|uniref:MOB kinase activator 2 isoform X4 n=1 Tax=Pseudonaja textilis TaxID=8673 RepID=UPI000EA87EE3|nr:MOB kinase activator 2 isoform X4 [Pseudonaja textilis]
MDWLMGKSKGKPNGKKPAAEEKKLYLEPEYTKSRITDFEFKELVILPREIDLNEWLASNTTTFFHHINLQYSTISEFCTGESCQTMAVCNTQYYWYDERGKKIKCTGPQYVDFVMSSVQKLVTDEDVFPTKYGKEFPNSFESLVKKICKYLFHVLAHIYSSHFKETLALELHGHLNTHTHTHTHNQDSLSKYATTTGLVDTRDYMEFWLNASSLARRCTSSVGIFFLPSISLLFLPYSMDYECCF